MPLILEPIIIDTVSISEQFGLTKQRITSMLDNIAKGLAGSYARQLEKAAQEALHQTRRRYIQNIRVIDSGKLEGTVMLDYSKDPMVKMIEEGASAFDMKKRFLMSPKAKIGKNGGKYLTIPFRWGTPGIAGTSDVFSGIMPDAVYDIVKKKKTNIPVSGGGSRSAGLSNKDLSSLPKALQEIKSRAAIMDTGGNELFKAYQHKSSMFQGITKVQDPVSGQNSYHSFRRVSDRSDADAFIHPGIEKHELMRKTLDQFNIPMEIGNLIDVELSKFGF